MITKVHFVSFSPCGGTEKVAASLGRDIPLAKMTYNITLPQNRLKGLDFDEDDLVFLAFPVYGGRMPRFFPSLISSLHGKNTPAVMVAVYGNREYEGAFLDMHKAIRANGFKPIAAIAAIAEHSVAPRIAAGRPDADDAAKLAAYGERALRKAQGDAEMIDAPGAFPKWELSPDASVFPLTDTEVCNECGLCAEVCPTGAIPADAPQTTVVESCQACSACVKYCPQKARELGDAKTKKELSSHLLHALERKDPVLFV